MARQQYVSFDYDNFTEQGLKDVTKEFESNGLNVVSVDADNRPKRQSGVQTKRAVFTFDDGQTTTLQATSHGTIFQVRLNRKVLPVRNVDDLKKAIGEIADKVKANTKSYRRNLRNQDSRRKRSTVSPARISVKKQLEGYQQQIAELQEDNTKTTQQRDSFAEQVQTKQAARDDLTSQLEIERSRNEQLHAELDQLQKEVA